MGIINHLDQYIIKHEVKMKRKMKLLLSLTMCLSIVLFSTISCQRNDTKKIDTKAETVSGWPKEIYIGTSELGSTHHVITSAWGALLENSTGSKVRITPEPDSARILRAISGDTHLIFMDLGDLAIYYKGIGAYSDLAKENFYSVWLEFDPPMGFMVAGDSEIKTLKDIKSLAEQDKEIKVAHFAPATAWSMRVTQLLPAFIDINPEKLTPVPFGSINDMYYSILEGKADILCGGLSTSILPALMATPKGVRFLDMPPDDKEAWQRALNVLPTEWPGQTNTWGVPKDFRGLGCMIAPALYFATPDEDEDLIYRITKWLHQNYDSYKDAAAQAARMSLERYREFLDISAVPVHPGTVRYLKEIGAWTATDDTWNESAKALMQQYVNAWKEAEAKAKSEKIKIEMGNTAWETLWADMIKDIPPMRSRY